MKHFLILAFIPILFSCNKKDEFDNTYHFCFFPRLVSYIWSDYSLVLPAIEDDKGNMTYYAAQNFSGSEAKSDQIVLGLYTSNLNIDTVAFEILVKDDFVGRNELLSIWDLNSLTHYKPIRFLQEDFIKTNYVDEQEISVEEKIEYSYTKFANSLPASGSFNSVAPPIFQDYRLSEVKNLTITSNSYLFGNPPGASLNTYFVIYDLDPACVFYGNKQLALDHTQTYKTINEGFSIEKWLSYSPLSPCYVYFKLKSIPTELPLNDLIFTITMETADGEILECLSNAIKLIR